MSLLEIDGYDHGQVTASTPSRTNVGYAFGAAVTGRFGGKAGGSGGSATYTLPAANTGTAIVGLAFYTGAPNNSVNFVEVRDTGTVHVAVRYNSGTQKFDLMHGNGTTLASTTNTYSTNTWYYVELKATIADSGGTAVVRINESTVINFTGDTRNGAAAQFTQFVVQCGHTTQIVDDLYICDATGSAPYNDFLGDVRVSTRSPNGNGNASQLLGSDGNSTDNYLLVDEIPPSATDYVGSATVGQRDTYAYTALPTTSGQALAVRPLAFAHKSDAGAASFKIVSRLSGGTERVETAVALSATPNTPVSGDLRTVDPANAAWTIASVNSSEFGVEVA